MKLITQRQKKIAGLIQKELALMVNNDLKLNGNTGLIVSISKVIVSVDISLAKVYISVYPSEKGIDFLSDMKENQFKLKHALSKKIKNQLRKTPELAFFIDDSLDYIEDIDSALKNPDNPIDRGISDSK
ncbi:MAG: ribosome-binding factor A [Flavobacteriales bacterium]|nr:ribosome-binding factor A [Flavobacteriales bacterium]|tara:strand:- start:98 stop:484 length:387 start_codon:yes stop_codon:yes gene_type:complete